MGKGTIINHIGDGQYNVATVYDRDAITTSINALTAKQTALDILILNETDELKKRLLLLQRLSVHKRIEYLSDANHVPEDKNIIAWCADLTEDLTGDVGLVEIGREQANGVNIQPGYSANAVYNATRDGQLIPLLAQTPAATFYNLAMLPGAQKWLPTYLYGEITYIDYDLHTCSLNLDLISSSQQSLDILPEGVFAYNDVPIRYMNCDSIAFAIGDEVLVSFEDYLVANIKVIGFKHDPKPCGCWIEPWDGPLYDTRYPWVPLQQVLAKGTPPVLPGPVYSITDGVLSIDIAQTASGLFYYDAQYVLRYDLTGGGSYIKENVSRVLFDATGSTYRDIVGYLATFFMLQMSGQIEIITIDEFGEEQSHYEDIAFYIYIVSNSNELGRVLIGCIDEPTDPTDWYDYYGDNNWQCTINNNNTDYITLPVTGVKISTIQLFMGMSAGYVPPYPPYINGLNVTVNKIELC